MTRNRLALVLLALAPAAASAQPPAKPKTDISKQIIGIWEGPYQSDQSPPGGLKLTVARGADGAWQATLEIFSDEAPPAGDVRDFKVEADTVSWAQTVAEFECLSKATLVAGSLKGVAECWQSGALALTAGFLLEKKKP